MPLLELKPLAISMARPGDFGARRAGDALLVPRQLLGALDQLSVRNGVELVSYLNAFPSAVASALGWSVDDVMRARAVLLKELRGVLPDDILSPPPPPKRVFGALPPIAVDERRP